MGQRVLGVARPLVPPERACREIDGRRSALRMRESGPERNPKVQVEGLVEALTETLGRKQRLELLGALSC